jgi:hypothetical protein
MEREISFFIESVHMETHVHFFTENGKTDNLFSLDLALKRKFLHPQQLFRKYKRRAAFEENHFI